MRSLQPPAMDPSLENFTRRQELCVEHHQTRTSGAAVPLLLVLGQATLADAGGSSIPFFFESLSHHATHLWPLSLQAFIF
jgi:hypothetical protein